MFDPEHHQLAARLIERATQGLGGTQLIAAIRQEFPDAPLRLIAHAGFIAITRPSVSPEALSSIYDMAICARRPDLKEMADA
ncbi:hypothetical protein [Methylocystis bryophila]|uniref:Uncharacterized protein n=1 Tax=Methylocystis bryophila TaxID=655015 RepID=A0A1W6MVU6_9HYPH|nr:hypothetical protein [Methylocystis bryophila]ARN81714.1 hypothetical protein B1812_12230 [Methylocystis bryophila]BDV37766.1 hypothetical protein DSM21852_10190 [Methylocystis bryophila]